MQEGSTSPQAKGAAPEPVYVCLSLFVSVCLCASVSVSLPLCLFLSALPCTSLAWPGLSRPVSVCVCVCATCAKATACAPMCTCFCVCLCIRVECRTVCTWHRQAETNTPMQQTQRLTYICAYVLGHRIIILTGGMAGCLSANSEALRRHHRTDVLLGGCSHQQVVRPGRPCQGPLLRAACSNPLQCTRSAPWYQA